MKLEQFCNGLQMQQKHPKTIQNYARYISEFLLYVKEEGVPVQHVQPMHIKQYFSVYKQTKASQTVLYAVSALKQYFKFLRIEQDMYHNPIEILDLQMQNKEEPAPPVVTEEVYQQVMEVMQEEGKRYCRERMAIHLMYQYKCNVDAVVGLKWEQYRAQQGILYTKRALSLREDTIKMLEDYINHSGDKEWMFAAKKGTPLTESGLKYLIRTALDTCGFQEWKLRDFYKKGPVKKEI